jgi:hypothetical protein
MALTTDIGERLELVPMDPHGSNISIALYRQHRNERSQFVVHTYSRLEGARQRIEFVARAMSVLGGMESDSKDPLRLWFSCHAEHRMAVRRIFLEACKLPSQEPLTPRPLVILDKKSNRTITVTSLGNGVYGLAADGEEEGKASRIAAVAGGLMKLGEMAPVEPTADRIAFSCRQPHDAMVGVLLIRALNVRAVLREQEMTASRGILAAPSAQSEA